MAIHVASLTTPGREFSPLLAPSWQYRRDVRTGVMQPIDDAAPYVTLRPADTRTGQLEFLFRDRADAEQAEAILTAGDRFELVNTDQAADPDAPLLAPTRNHVMNPSFETDTARWTRNAAIASMVSTAGVAAAGDRFAVITGSSPAGVAYMLATPSANTLGARWAAARVAIRNSGPAGLYAAPNINGRAPLDWRPCSTAPLTDHATVHTVVSEVPEDANDRASLFVFFAGADAGPPPEGWRAEVDAAMLVVADTRDAALAGVADYFDGSTPPARSPGTVQWDGTANDSSSTFTPAGVDVFRFVVTGGVDVARNMPGRSWMLRAGFREVR